MKVVIDTNDFISAMIGRKHLEKLSRVLVNNNVEIFGEEKLITEIRNVGYREKFRKYISINDVDLFVETIKLRLTFIETKTEIFDCNDPNDNYLLSLAVDSDSQYLITGDKKDLISMNPYKGINIIKLHEFLEIMDPI
jgi:uncharacterized protein